MRLNGMENTKAKQDYFLLKKLYHNSHIPVCVYEKNRKIISIPDMEESQDIFNCDQELFLQLTATADRKNVPVIFMDDILVFFGVFRGEDGRYYIWGPATLEKQDDTKQIAFRWKHHIEDKNFQVEKSSYEILANIMTIACYHYYGLEMEESDIFWDWNGEEEKYAANVGEMERYQLEKSEMNWIHDSIEYENQFIKAVEDGDVVLMKQLMHVNTTDVGGIGVVAHDAYKQMEYLCVSSVTLVSRAAIRGGMNPETAYEMSDVYMQRIEKCKTIEELGLVCSKMQIDYAEKVHQFKKRKRGNIYVEKCKDYIAKNLRSPFQISEMADDLEVNRSYLSRIFSEQEGLTIQQYIIREKCSHAANMLKYTDYNISIISDYFCFVSQSHFGKQFKSIYGMTPNEYRKQNRYIGSYIK